MNKIVKAGLGLGLAGIVALGLAPRFTNAPEKYLGFEAYSRKGYTLLSYEIPTKGDVVLIRKLPHAAYTEIKEKDGSLVLTGPFYYQIEPDPRFAPQDEVHTDMYGRTPTNPQDDYWGDTRIGSVILEKIK